MKFHDAAISVSLLAIAPRVYAGAFGPGGGSFPAPTNAGTPSTVTVSIIESSPVTVVSTQTVLATATAATTATASCSPTPAVQRMTLQGIYKTVDSSGNNVTTSPGYFYTNDALLSGALWPFEWSPEPLLFDLDTHRGGLTIANSSSNDLVGLSLFYNTGFGSAGFVSSIYAQELNAPNGGPGLSTLMNCALADTDLGTELVCFGARQEPTVFYTCGISPSGGFSGKLQFASQTYNPAPLCGTLPLYIIRVIANVQAA